MTGPPDAAGVRDRPAALAAFGDRAELDEGIALDGEGLVFPPRAAWLRVRIDLTGDGGAHRLVLQATGAGALRVELEAGPRPVALQLSREGDRFVAVFHAMAPARTLRLMPVEAGRVVFAEFALAPCGRTQSLLPDFVLGAVRLPHRQQLPAPLSFAARRCAGWSNRITVDAVQNIRIADPPSRDTSASAASTGPRGGLRCEAGPSGALRLVFEPPLAAGTHELIGRFVGADGHPALVAPRLYLADHPENAPPAAHFRTKGGDRYRALLKHPAPIAALVFQPRQERGVVHVATLDVRPLNSLKIFLSFQKRILGDAIDHLTGRLERALGGDRDGDGLVRALFRLATLADRRYRAHVRAFEARAVSDWLARPAVREGPLRVHIDAGKGASAKTRRSLEAADGPVALVERAADADIVLSDGDALARHAPAAMLRAPAGSAPLYDIDRAVLGLRSAPAFRALPQAGDGGAPERGQVPLVMVHQSLRRRGEASYAAPLADRPPPRAAPQVSIITATKDAPHHLSRFLATLARTEGPAPELILVDNDTTEPKASVALTQAKGAGHVVLHDDRPFNFAALSNLGAAHATGEVLIFANNDIAFDEPGWLRALWAGLDRPHVGVAGALLRYPNGLVQHAGLVLAGEARVRHLARFARSSDKGYLCRRDGVSDVTAVTGALMAVRRDDFRALGGFRADRYPVLYNDVDLCLRANRAGLRTVLAADASAVHHESVSIATGARDLGARGSPIWRLERALEADRFRQDWADLLDRDPCHPTQCDPLDGWYRARV